MPYIEKIFIVPTDDKSKLKALVHETRTGIRFEIEDDGHYPTQNRTEINLIIKALRFFFDGETVYVACNSTYVTNMFNKHLVDKWLKNGWVTQQNTTVKNLDLIYELVKLTKKLNISFFEPLPVVDAFEGLYD